MQNEITNVLSQAKLEQCHKLIADAKWLPGTGSAGAQARHNKTNEEMDQQCASWAAINQIVVATLYSHPIFQSLVLPSKVSAAFVSRCKTGMQYGQHIDDPLMGTSNARYRSDVAVTVFLSEPDTYDGGELCIESNFGPIDIKLPAGCAVAYPASSLHQVKPVTRGERVVCALWAQSMVQDAERRAILHGLDEARQALVQSTPNALVTQQIERTYANLLRRWADV